MTFSSRSFLKVLFFFVDQFDDPFAQRFVGVGGLNDLPVGIQR
jgi:hypothetical protein